jgi:hypothetical protein
MADEDIQKEPLRDQPLPQRPDGAPDYDEPDAWARNSRRPLRPGGAPLDYNDDAFVRERSPVESFIPYHNPMGLIAYYLGVFSFIPCLGLLLGPAAFILGILGVRYRNRNPTAGGLGHAISGIVMGSLTSLANWGVLIAAVIGMIIAANK